jgi:hypothetical protein
MTLTRRPKWIKDEEVAEWVIVNCRGSLLRAMGLEEDFSGDIYSTEPATHERNTEKEAVEAARLGFPKKLIDHVLIEAYHWENSKHYINGDYAPSLTPEMLRLLAEFASGKRKRKRGGQKLTEFERAIRTPTHDAANYNFPAVMQVLSEEYPDQPPKDLPDRAYFIVNHMIGVKNPHKDTRIKVYRNKPRRGKHAKHRI